MNDLQHPNMRHARLLSDVRRSRLLTQAAKERKALREIAETVPDGGPAFLLVEKARCVIGYTDDARWPIPRGQAGG